MQKNNSTISNLSYHVHARGRADPFSSMNSTVEEEEILFTRSRLNLESKMKQLKQFVPGHKNEDSNHHHEQI